MSQAHPRIVFHIGAHKTATTHLQHSIGAVSDLLAADGVQFFGPQSLRGPGKRLEARFDLPFNPRKSVADPRPNPLVLDEMVQGGDRLVLSEENFIGVLFDENKRGKKHRLKVPLYPNAGERLMALAQQIAPDGLDLCLGVRSPTEFLESVYGQALLADYIVRAEDFRDANPISLVDWADLIARLRLTPGVRSVTVWRQEEYHKCLPQILRIMLGDAARHVKPIARRVNPGLSRAAVEAVHRMKDGGETGPLASLARDTYPVSAENPPFRLYKTDAKALSAEFFQAQLDVVEQMDDVTLLRPEG